MASALVWGSGGHGRVVADLARSNGHVVAGYADVNRERAGFVVDALGGRVLGDDAFLEGWMAEDDARILVLGVGANEPRLAMSRRFADGRIPALVHPTAAIAEPVTIGAGSVVLASAVMNASAQIGRGVIINSAAVIEHDVIVGDGVHVSPGAVLTGACRVEEGAWVGANATVLPGVRIGSRAVVGAGAVVLEDVPDGSTVVGNPARVIR
jgi:sugar O-acyltransferase (sialic acid O-acetyltransferase NeuD family)